MNVGDLLRRSARAEVYRWGAEHVVKLFLSSVTPEEVEREAQAASMARAAGLPVPGVQEVISLKGRLGIIHTYIAGEPLDDFAAGNPGLMQEMAQRMAQLHRALHQVSGHGLPCIKRVLTAELDSGWVEHTPAYQRARDSLARLPAGESLLHGSFHPRHLLVDEGGELHLIDWSGVTQGHAWADVARSYLLLHLGKTHLPRDRWWLSEGLKTFYVEHYLQDEPKLMSQVMQWLPVLVAARMTAGVLAEQGELEKLLKRRRFPKGL